MSYEKNVLVRTNVFVCAVIVVGYIVTSLISYFSNQGIFKHDTESVSNLTAEGIYHQIDSIFSRPISISLTMANDSLLKEFLSEELSRKDDEAFIQTMRDYLRAYKEKYDYDSVFLVSTETNRYYNFDGVDRVLTEGNPENVWYYAELESEQEYSLNIDNDEVASANNEINVFINCKIKDGQGRTMGIVGVGFRVGYIQTIFQEYEEGYGIKAYLVDKKGIIQISTRQTGYKQTDLFTICGYPEMKEKILAETKDAHSYWYSYQKQTGHLVTQYIPTLDWHLIIENDTSSMEKQLNRQFYAGILIIVLVVLAVLFTITGIIRKYNREIVRLTVEEEKTHRTVFQMETEKMYENIYEVDITHNRVASEATEEYFESLGVPKKMPYDKALHIIAEKQIKEEFRDGYIATFKPENVLRAYEEGLESLRYDFMISNDGGSTYYWMRITARMFYWEEDKSVRILVYRQNVDKEKKHERWLVEKMERDSLTGLYNKAATQKYICRTLYDEPERMYAFFIVDIDNFKSVNDRCGHAFGDRVIAGFADILKGKFRSGDIVGRIGGDEFVVFVPVPFREWAVSRAVILTEALHHEFAGGDRRCTVSASIGVAIAPESGTDFETLYRNADAALYCSKEKGKNGFTIHSDLQAADRGE